jgi:hypothetical protein
MGMGKPSLTLLVPYRNRRDHLDTLIAWWAADPSCAAGGDIEIIVAEVDAQPTEARELVLQAGFSYEFVNCAGVLHKSRALNLGLAKARGELVTPFDVDLVPIDNTLHRHREAALGSPKVLMTGYRLLTRRRRVDPPDIRRVAEKARVSSEDGKSALRKHLLFGERFGHVPMFQKRILESIGGWDEEFLGWGSDDQDVIERYLRASGSLFVRVPDFTYLHLFHETAPLWNERQLVEDNRKRYYMLRKATENSQADISTQKLDD